MTLNFIYISLFNPLWEEAVTSLLNTGNQDLTVTCCIGRCFEFRVSFLLDWLPSQHDLSPLSFKTKLGNGEYFFFPLSAVTWNKCTGRRLYTKESSLKILEVSYPLPRHGCFCQCTMSSFTSLTKYEISFIFFSLIEWNLMLSFVGIRCAKLQSRWPKDEECPLKFYTIWEN